MLYQSPFHNVKGFYFFKLVLFGLIIGIGCKNSATITERIGDVLEGGSELKRYAVGKGNSFADNYEEYILREDGKVFKRDFKYDREVFTKQLSETDLHYFLEKISELGLDGLSIFEPGNNSYYIEIREGNISINKLVWGANTYYPPTEVVKFHEELFLKLAAWE